MIDWAGIYHRLAHLQSALDQVGAVDAEQTRLVLRERARLLARPVTNPALSGDDLDILEFRLADEHYGLETAHIAEAAAITAITKVPGTPDFVAGIVTLRGQILPALDLGRLFELPAASSGLDWVIVLGDLDNRIGVLATSIIGVATISRAAIEPPVPTLTGGRANYLLGLSQTRVALLDAEALLSAPGLIVDADRTSQLDRIAASAGGTGGASP